MMSVRHYLCGQQPDRCQGESDLVRTHKGSDWSAPSKQRN
uniref:Uncharacterized protein n=1 Tax=Anguilla anguilla TaxID=7936 RepID=A0A0E9S3B4_ANGAN